ncbi:MAG: hypothetical protein QS99_C0007G0023 [archaeon GW2011_AR4]|nr:MAG: hypothetical protein QS99_C0007G0023 [archaeon GW2011_AR4]
MPVRAGPGLGLPAGDAHYNAANAMIAQNAAREFDLPLWSPYTMSGTPFYAKPQVPFFYITYPLYFLAPTPWAFLKWSLIIHLLIAGIAMYSLFWYMRKDKYASFIAALCYMFSGYITADLFGGHPNIVFNYAWVPLIVLFSIKAMKEDHIKNAIWTGIFLSLQVMGGGPEMFLYTLLFVGIIFLFYLITSDPSKMLKKVLIAGIIIILVFAGLTAHKFLPLKELMKISVRNQGYSMENSLGDPTEFREFWHDLVRPGPRNIGFIPFLLLLFALPLWKKKDVSLFMIMAIFALLMLSGSFVYFLVWKFIPYYNKMDDIFKGIFLFILPACYLAGVGIQQILHHTDKKLKIKKGVIVGVLAFLIILDLLVFVPDWMGSADRKTMQENGIIYPARFAQRTSPPYVSMQETLERNTILQRISEDKSLYRIHVQETNGIDWGTDTSTIPLGLQDVYGTENIWLVDYMPMFLSVANSDPAKLFGILNTKYITSTTPLNISGYRFIGKASECGPLCQPIKIGGPYLYQNDLWLPRYYHAPNAVLVIGSRDNKLQAMYFLLTNPNLNPAKTIIIYGKDSINEYTPDDLGRFSMILLTPGSIDEKSGFILEQYAKSGGMLMPDILSGEQQIFVAGMGEALQNLSREGGFEELSYSFSSGFDTLTLDVHKSNGWVFLSEQYSMYQGWEARVDGKETAIERADGVLSAVYVPKGASSLVMTYHPRYLTEGIIISLISISIISGALFYGKKE